MRIKQLRKVMHLDWGCCYINDVLDSMSEENEHLEIVQIVVQDNGVVRIYTRGDYERKTF